MKHTLEQLRAKYALDVINNKISNSKAAEYGSIVRRLPSMILNNGLGQSLAFLKAKAKSDDRNSNENNEMDLLYKDLQDWLCGEIDNDKHPRRIYKEGEFIKLLIEGDRSQYFQAQQESLSLLTWMKKFADAYLPKSEGA